MFENCPHVALCIFNIHCIIVEQNAGGKERVAREKNKEVCEYN